MVTKGDCVRHERSAEMGKRHWIGPDMDKTTFGDLATLIEQNYLVNQRRSLPRDENLSVGLPSILRAVLCARPHTGSARRLRGRSTQ